VTNDNEQRATLSLLGPISDTVGFRLSGSYRHYGGNVENLYTNSKINSDETFSVHGKVEWKPTEKFNAVFSAHFSQDNAVCCGQPLTRLDQPTLTNCLAHRARRWPWQTRVSFRVRTTGAFRSISRRWREVRITACPRIFPTISGM
jgi:outer membrane receptor protein involved in Fe transport